MTNKKSEIDELVSQSEFIIKEAKAKYKNPVLLWAGGKDSTAMLAIAMKAFAKLKKFPFKVMFLDTGYQFTETYEYLEKYAKEWNLDFIRQKNEKALKEGINPFTTNRLHCWSNSPETSTGWAKLTDRRSSSSEPSCPDRLRWFWHR